ncbi:MAG TPA: MATE family efflux transporter [Phycisphaerales bacterium]|nr:MATE family efflux transporter [Phycisphaerales bacterium]
MSAAVDPAPRRPERTPFMELLVIAAPTVAAMTSYTLMQFVDKLMVSRIGPDPIYVGAQGNGGLCAFVPIAVAMGCLTVVNTYVAQNLGAKTPERAPAYCWAGLWLSLAWWLVLMIPYGLVLPHVFDWVRPASADPAELASLIRRDALAGEYGRILIFGSIFTMGARGVSQYFYGMHKPVVVLASSVTANLLNFALNTMLVFGPHAPTSTGLPVLDWWFHAAAHAAAVLGIPAQHMRGSAIATVIGTFVEFCIPMVVFLSPKFNRLYGTIRAWRPSRSHALEVLHIGWPSALMFGNEMICWTIFMVAQVGHFGTNHSTAGWIAHQWMSLSFMPTFGISVAITAMVGKSMGAGRPDQAAARAWLGLRAAVIYMSACGVCFVLFRRSLIGLFIEPATDTAQRAEVLDLGAGFLIATAAFQFFDGVAMSLGGALRGAGDTRWPGLATLVLSWTVIVGGGWAFVYLAPGLSSTGPWIAAAAYIILLSLALGWRFIAGTWKTMRLVHTGDNAPADVRNEPDLESSSR